jgi:hypothetical protein
MGTRQIAPIVIGIVAAIALHYFEAPDALAVIGGVVLAIACRHPPPKAAPPQNAEDRAPPPTIDLGEIVKAPIQSVELFEGQRFRLALHELDRHVAVIGATGSGKTTTLTRLADAALAERWPVLIIDAKGGQLSNVTSALGARHGLPARVWLPGHPDTWAYDMCAGDPVAVGNRIVGAFEYGFEGQVYRNLAQSIVPLVIGGMLESGMRCDLDTLRFCLDRAHLTGLVRRLPDSLLKAELMTLREDDLHRSTLAGLLGRLRALRFGLFGQWLVPGERTLDLAESLVAPGVTYLGLPATAASEDVALVGRILVQHVKQVAYQALWTAERTPALIIFDEFVSLREAAQLVDLLLQAREARLSVVVSTQHVPRAHPLRQSVLSAGTLIVHQVGHPEDAEVLARALGSRTAHEVARQLVVAPETTVARRLLRARDTFLIAPDDIAHLAVGQAAVMVRFGQQRVGVVQIDPLRMT